MGAGFLANVIAAEPQKSSTQQLWGGNLLLSFAASRHFEPKYPKADIYLYDRDSEWGWQTSTSLSMSHLPGFLQTLV